MEWIIWFELIMEFIQKCQENRSKKAIVAGLCNPGAREYFACWKIAGQEMGLRGKARRREAKKGIAELRSLSRKEVKLLVSGNLGAFLKSVG